MEQLNVEGIKNASQSIRSLQNSLKSCEETMSEMTNSLSAFAVGVLNIGLVAADAYVAIDALKPLFSSVKERMTEGLDFKIVKDFGDAIGQGALFAGDRLKDYKKHLREFADGIKQIPHEAKEEFGAIKGDIKTFGRTMKESLGNVKESVKNFSFSDLKAKVKELPDMFDSGIKGAGDKLYKNAESVGKGAGKLLSVGLTGGIALAAVAITGLIASFMHLMDSNKAFKEEVTEAWGKVKEAFQPAIDAFNTFKETLFGASDEDGFTPFVENILAGVTGIIEFIAEAAGTLAEFIAGFLEGLTAFWSEHGESILAKMSEIWGGIKDTVTSVWEAISVVVGAVINVLKAIWEKYGTDIMDVVTKIWDFISGIVSAAQQFISGVADIIVGIFTLNGDKIKEGIGKLWDGISGLFSTGVDFIKGIFESLVGIVSKVFSGIVSFFGGLWDKIKKIFTTIGTKVGNAIGGAFKGAINGVIGFAQRIINGFIRNINSVIGLINKIPGVSIGKISTVSLPRLASGGLVDAGQMFIARERGPELVGTFGNRTAVMNNSQIVDAVSKGVYAAVKSAMGGEGSFTFNIMNQLDGKAIGEQVIKYHNGIVKQTGSSPLYV